MAKENKVVTVTVNAHAKEVKRADVTAIAAAAGLLPRKSANLKLVALPKITCYATTWGGGSLVLATKAPRVIWCFFCCSLP